MRVRNIVNDELLRMSYSEPKNIKNFLRNWGGLESLSLKGDTVATCILVDLKRVTGIDPELYDRQDRAAFDAGYQNGELTYYQFMSIAYTLVLEYSQEDIAYVMGVDQSVISKNIRTGVKRIIKVLEGGAGEDKVQKRG